MDINQLSCLIISDFTVETLADLLRNDGLFPSVRTSIAPFNQVTRVLIDQEMSCWKSKPDFAIVWTRPEAMIESFDAALNYKNCPTEKILEEVDHFAELLRGIADRVEFVFVPTWTLPYYHRGFGILNMRKQGGLSYLLMQMNLHLASALESPPNVYLLDASRWIAAAGKKSTNPKLWLMGKIAFGTAVFQESSADIKAGLRGLAGLSKKLILVDLDDTLWGGIVGDEGWENLNLGGHNPVGEAFVEFQKELKALTNRGILLGIVSKNDEAIAIEAIDNHPEMLLRLKDFVGWRINWRDKAENIIDLVAELNLGLESVVFIDDNPAERFRVKEALPQVLVPDWPADKMHYKRALLELQCFDTPAFTEEDLARTKMYVSERQRTAIRQSMKSVEEWLVSLGLIVKVELLDETNLMRSTQLLNKTNQMNLSTRRMGEAEFLKCSQHQDHQVFVFRASDRFGDSGLVGIASLKVDGSRGQIQDFVLSCRMMGRGVERTMLHVLVNYGQSRGLEEIVAVYLPTERNKPCLEFFQKGSGFDQRGAENHFAWDLNNEYPAPSFIQLEMDAGDQG